MCKLYCMGCSSPVSLPFIITLIFVVTVSSTEHVVVHVNRATVLDGIAELLGKDLLRRVLR